MPELTDDDRDTIFTAIRTAMRIYADLVIKSPHPTHAYLMALEYYDFFNVGRKATSYPVNWFKPRVWSV